MAALRRVLLFWPTVTVRRAGSSFGTDGDGDSIVLARDNSSDGLSGNTYTLEGIGSVYSIYAMIFGPVTGTADIFVNGNEVISDYAGFDFVSAASMNFGAGSSLDTGEGRFAEVSLATGMSVVPLPAAAWLFGSALVLLGWMRRKKV